MREKKPRKLKINKLLNKKTFKVSNSSQPIIVKVSNDNFDAIDITNTDFIIGRDVNIITLIFHRLG